MHRLIATVLFIGASLAASAEAERGIMVRPAMLYIAPDDTSAKLGEVGRGREVVVIERSRSFAKVFANVDRGRDLTGWIRDRGIVLTTTPNGDQILYGEAVDSEAEASRRGGRKGAAQDAMRLYYRMAEYFPNSPLAGEALYRAADIRWQIEARDVRSRPSARAADPEMRAKVDEEAMKEVRKKFSGTKWADLAEFQLIDNKLCGEWQNSSKCPEREANIYEEYAREHPKSPKAAEALYEAARRYAALAEIYIGEEKEGKSKDAKARARELAQRIITQHPQTDWAARAQALSFKLEHEVPIYSVEVR
jgi:hypothetical protein